MDTPTQFQSTARRLPIANLQLSRTPAQGERRQHFDKDKLQELAASIKSTGGLIQSIVVRPVQIIRTEGLNGLIVAGKTYFSPDEAEKVAHNKFEIVAGERRYLAAKLAGLTEIDCSVRDLTDEQVEEIQLVENLQREDLHELAEAEGYEALQKRGHSIDEMADKVGKSKATIYARMKLLALCKDARKAFYAGKLSASTALLLARLVGEDVQKKAMKEIIEDRRFGDGPMSYREAAEHIHENYMLRLDDAGFPTQDATLVPAAGTCGACPKRTGNQPELFGDIKNADVCTDSACFKTKREAFAMADAQGLCARLEQSPASRNPLGVASYAVRIADALIAELAK
jgi:ParB/RepB/Spo0J family partition protein